MIRAPEIIPDEDPRRPHQTWLIWSTDDDAPAHALVWRTDANILFIKGFVANEEFRGRAMLHWIQAAWGLCVHVVEVIPSAMGFWDRMSREGLVTNWDASDGFASPFERDAVPLGPPDIRERRELAWTPRLRT